MPTVEEVIRNRFPSDKKAVVAVAIWCAEDVLQKAKEMNIECSQQQAEDVLEHIDDHQDCELGITWMTLECELEELRSIQQGKTCPACKMPVSVCMCHPVETHEV